MCGIAVAKLDHARGANYPVVCTDGILSLIPYIEANALANGVSLRAAHLLWGDTAATQALLRRLDRCQPGAVLGADIIYQLDAIPALVATIVQLDPKVALLAARLRDHEVRDALAEHTRLAGWCVEERQRGWGEQNWDTVILFSLEKRGPVVKEVAHNAVSQQSGPRQHLCGIDQSRTGR